MTETIAVGKPLGDELLVAKWYLDNARWHLKRQNWRWAARCCMFSRDCLAGRKDHAALRIIGGIHQVLLEALAAKRAGVRRQ